MICNRYHPSQHLSHVIAYFWTLQSKNDDDYGNLYRLVPDGYVDWVFHLQEPWAFSQSKKSKSKKKFQSHLFGHTKDYIDLVLPPGPLSVFGVKFHPWAAHNIWNINMNEVTDLEVSLSDLNDSILNCLEEQILEIPSLFGKIKRIESILEKRIQPANNKDLQPIIKSIIKDAPTIDLQEYGSQRRLQQRFQAEVGISQKMFQRIIRINQLLEKITQSPKPPLTAITYQFGYFDQSHFIHDFRKFTGLSPSRFLQSINPSEDIFNLKIS